MPDDQPASFPVFEEHIPTLDLRAHEYRARFARTIQEVEDVQRLRYNVFNVELDEGLESAHETGRDADDFDLVCHHLLVENTETDEIIGTYRMQTHAMADAELGFYSAQEFDLSSWPSHVLENSVELGRACIAQEHRSLPVLNLLWKGIGAYLAHNAGRYLFGCSSLTSQNPADGLAVLKYFDQEGLLHPSLWATPQPGYQCATDEPVETAHKADIPRLMRVYINTGARICGPPAIDRAFQTIDFLTFYDIETLEPQAARFFGLEDVIDVGGDEVESEGVEDGG
jgi:putative hemolysin